MANPEHVAKLREGIGAWNQWRKQNPDVSVDLSSADFTGADLSGVDLRYSALSMVHFPKANLTKANFDQANLSMADLTGAHLSEANFDRAILVSAELSRASLVGANLHSANLLGANLSGADLSRAYLVVAYLLDANLREASLAGAQLDDSCLIGADFTRADLTGAKLSGADLNRTKFGNANLREADLTFSTAVETNFEGADLTSCFVYGISAWNVKLDGAIQSNLVITRSNESPIQIDNLEVAQFIYLLLNNSRIREVIDTIGKKAVLILGRFAQRRKAVLDAIREGLRYYGYLPILFDFEKPGMRDTQETIVTLAGMSRFIIADITDPKSIPQELASIVPNLVSVPVQPLLQTGYEPWGMYDHIRRYPWVLPLVAYKDQQSLLTELEAKVLLPAEQKAKEQTRK